MTHTQQHAALARRICLEPASLDLRLVYADWCEEHGGEDGQVRASFIRLQIELEEWGTPEERCHCSDNSPPDGCGWCRATDPLRRRERDLFQIIAHPQEEVYLLLGNDHKGVDRTFAWQPEPLTNNNGMRYRNGFCEEIRCTAATWLAHGAEIVRAVPVCRVTLSDRKPLRFTPDSGSASFDWPDQFSWGRIGNLSVSLTDAHWLPDEIWNLLDGEPGNGRYKRYDTEQAALDTLSVACVRWARRQAKLDVPDGVGGWRVEDQ